jgi:hypothetical protein
MHICITHEHIVYKSTCNERSIPEGVGCHKIHIQTLNIYFEGADEYE